LGLWGESIPWQNPATQEVLGRVPENTQGEVEREGGEGGEGWKRVINACLCSIIVRVGYGG